MTTYPAHADTPELRAAYDALSPAARAVADRFVAYMDSLLAERQAAPEIVGDGDRVVVLDDGQHSGVAVERHDDREGPSWLDFWIGRRRPAWLRVSVDLVDGKPGLDLTIDGHGFNEGLDEIWTLDDLKRLHTDLGRMLTDERLLGALAENAARWAAEQETQPC